MLEDCPHEATDIVGEIVLCLVTSVVLVPWDDEGVIIGAMEHLRLPPGEVPLHKSYHVLRMQLDLNL